MTGYLATVESPSHSKPRVVALGSGAGKVVNRMIHDGAVDAEFVALNTDAQDLKRSLAGVKLLLGAKVTRGLGAVGDDEVGRDAVLADRALVESALDGAPVVVVVACLGGGTGSGGASFLCEAARAHGAEVRAVVAMPFPFEGKRRRRVAEHALARLQAAVGPACTVVEMSAGEGLTMQAAFAELDARMAEAVQAGLTLG